MAQEEQTRPKFLTCACCGERARGRQWWNRDTGYGVCSRCFRASFLRDGREEAERLLSGFTLNSTRLFDYADSYLRAARTYGVQYGIGAKWQHFVKTIESSHGESLSNALSIVDRNGRIIDKIRCIPDIAHRTCTNSSGIFP